MTVKRYSVGSLVESIGPVSSWPAKAQLLFGSDCGGSTCSQQPAVHVCRVPLVGRGGAHLLAHGQDFRAGCCPQTVATLWQRCAASSRLQFGSTIECTRSPCVAHSSLSTPASGHQTYQHTHTHAIPINVPLRRCISSGTQVQWQFDRRSARAHRDRARYPRTRTIQTQRSAVTMGIRLRSGSQDFLYCNS